jgi:D-alanine-D-alanine ligase
MTSVDFRHMDVTVLYGGTSAEREISLRSGAAVAKCLEQAGAKVTHVDPAIPNWLNDLSSDTFVFNMLHGVGGEDGSVQGALDTVGIRYSGSGVLGSAIAMHKDKTKRIWQACGLPTPRFVMLEAETDSASVIDDLGPVFVKPVAEGSSFGLATADTADDLEIARDNGAEHAMPLMAETRIHGDELTVAILGDRALPAIQIVPQGGYYDFDAKYVSGATEFICPAPLSPNDANQLETLALAAFQAVGAHGWGRVDLMRDDSGWWLLEINTVPGMTETSLVPKAAAAAGMSFEALLAEIYLSSEARYGC